MAVYSERFGQFIQFTDDGGTWVVKNPRGDIIGVKSTQSAAQREAVKLNLQYQETEYHIEQWENRSN